MATDSTNQSGPSRLDPKVFSPVEPVRVEPTIEKETDSQKAAPTLPSLDLLIQQSSLSQINQIHLALKNKAQYNSLQKRVSKYYDKFLWECLFICNQKEWVRWIKREAKFVQEIVERQRLDERNRKIWETLKGNFNKEMKKIRALSHQA